MTEGDSGYTPVTEKWADVPVFAKLNDRELTFLTHAVNGLTNKQIAETCDVQPYLVDKVMKAAINKVKTLDGVGDQTSTYSRRQSIAPLLIKNGYFEPVKQD
ncbi:MAG: LuxR C-terminal-related transcriptional regulator [Patescibacteria group bacterium]|nr:LuxR C-terminal-related transcriptional regulator [Patescibacteria group bacterium]